MPATITSEVVGVKDTIKALRQLDPELRKQWNRDIKAVLAPAISKVKSSYPRLPLSGMAREWTPNTEAGYTIFPWNYSKVKRGVTVKTSTRKNKNAVVYVSQANPAGVLFETVGLGNELGRNIRTVSPRLLWPIIDEMTPQIIKGVEEIVVHAERTIQGKVRYS
jgi:hypothetical protein